MTDKTNPPEGYRIFEMSPKANLANEPWWLAKCDLESGGEFWTEAEAIAACWAHADRQRAIGYEQGKAEEREAHGDMYAEIENAFEAVGPDLVEAVLALRAQLATAKADGRAEG